MKTQLIWLYSICALIFVALPFQTQAALFVIDNFSQGQYVIADNGSMVSSGPLSLNSASTDLSNVNRTLFSQSGTGLGAFQMVQSVGGVLQITNSSTSAGIASVLWDGFDAVDFITLGLNAFLLDILTIDHNLDIQIVINELSTSSVQNFSGPGEQYVSFADFNDSGVFSNVMSLRLNLMGPAAWDAQIRLFGSKDPSTVPEPSKFFLLSLTLIAFGFVKKNRSGS